MTTFRPSKAFSKSPTANTTIVTNPGQMLGYLNALTRVIDQNFAQITNNTNTTLVIDPEATVRTSIAGNTADFNKLRDFVATLVLSLKSNGGIN